MPETLFVRDFSAGWIPSDDAVDGRQNGQLQMSNLELDRNGALQLVGGTQQLYPAYLNYAFTMFSRYMSGVRYDYAACVNGYVYRNGGLFVTGGDTTNAAFGTAFDFTLICSGNARWKDNGSSVATLGVKPPTVAPTVTQNSSNFPYQKIGELDTAWVTPNGSANIYPVGGPYQYLQCHPDVNGIFIIQSYAVPGAPFNCTQLTGPAGTGTSTDDDLIVLNGYIQNPFGVLLQFDVLLDPGDGTGDTVTDFYSFAVKDISTQATFDALTGVFTLRMPRSQFQIYGSGAKDWSTVYGFRITVNENITAPSGVIPLNLWGLYMGDTFFKIKGGTIAQNGIYQYAQVNINNTGSYIAKSILGPISQPITIEQNNAVVTVQDPTTVDSQCNQAWIFRTGGNLGGSWYRIAVVTGPPFPASVYDAMGDQQALTLDITMNINLVSISSTTISDEIMDVVGPIQGRWYYFTHNFMYPSEINDPDLVDASLAVRLCGSNSELFMWARPVSASVVIVGTSIDCYLLTGTFSTFPDGTIDIYYQSLGVKFPPIAFDAVSYGGAVYYRAADGWRMVLPTSFGTTYSSQNNQLLTAPNTDRLYRGEVCYGYAPPTAPGKPGSVRYPITIVKNKLWCFVTSTNRCEVYDFVRNYWRTFDYGLGDVAACCSTQDNKLLASYTIDKITRELDYQSSKLVDGTTQQTYQAMFTYKDNGKPRQRKDTYTFKTRCYTGSGSMSLQITDEKTNLVNVPGVIVQSTQATSEVFLDLSQSFITNLPKAYLVRLYGQSDNLLIEDWSIDFDARPIPLTFLRIYPNNFGQAAQKRIRTWPFVIDTLGNSVVFTPSVDNVGYPPTVFNSTYKKTLFHYFTSDVFGIDYGGTLWVEQPGEMEVWDTGLGAIGYGPNNVQTLPEPTEFDQVGPLEIFRFGKVVRIALRCFSTGTPIPFAVVMSDQQVWNGVFNTTPGVEDEYIVDVPKGTSGRILRVTLGPCGFTFNRYFMKFQVAMSGGQKDTELQWITIPGLTSQLSGGI